MAVFDLKGMLDDVSKLCGDKVFYPPPHPCTRNVNGIYETLWVGKDHWLLRAPIEEEEKLCNILLMEELPEQISIVLISDRFRFYEICGEHIEVIFAGMSSIDFHCLPLNAATFTEVYGLRTLLIKYKHTCQLGFECCYSTMLDEFFRKAICDADAIVDMMYSFKSKPGV